MKLLNFTIIKLTICLIIGILIAYFTNVSLTYSLNASAFLLLVLLIFYLIAIKQFTKTVWFGFLAFLTTISIGILITNLHNQQHFKNHYSQKILIENSSDQSVTFRIKAVLKPSLYHNKYIVDILKVEGKSVSGKLLLNIQKDSLHKSLKVDEIFITTTPLENIKAPLNPNQFDYKHYLEKQYIYHQLYTENQKLFKVSSNKHTLFGFSDALRETINLKLGTFDIKPDELAIINALLLGQRQDISKATYNNYTNAGAIHILAVSGLHVGIILLLLSYVLKPIEYFKHGLLIKTVLLVILLWGFALIAGLSASVTRAVTMFSIVAIAVNLKRATNIYNTLAISMFVLLLFKPMFLFDVGFQLSYLAVFGIVWTQPLLYKIWKPKYRILDFFWKVFTVTLAAQIGVIPISLFYFHQFPGLFFISNLAIIPVLGIILGFGILVIVLALLNLLPEFLAQFYGTIISWMNNLIAWVAQQEQFLFKDIFFGILQLFVAYFFIIASILFLKKKNTIRLQLILVSIVLIQAAFIYNKYETANNAFIIFNKSRFTLIGQKNNNSILVTHNFDSITSLKDKTITNYMVANYIKKRTDNQINDIYKIDEKLLLIIDSLGVYNTKTFKPEYVLLRNSPKINLTRLIDSLNPKLIIADGSNYKSYVARWSKTCINKKLPFHQTSEKGAFIIEYAK